MPLQGALRLSGSPQVYDKCTYEHLLHLSVAVTSCQMAPPTLHLNSWTAQDINAARWVPLPLSYALLQECQSYVSHVLEKFYVLHTCFARDSDIFGEIQGARSWTQTEVTLLSPTNHSPLALDGSRLLSDSFFL